MVSDNESEGDPQPQSLERMKTEFLVAQQRRRDRACAAVAHPDHTNDGPLGAGPADGTLSGVAAVRP